MNEKQERYIVDLAERIGFTFLQAFGALLVVSGFFSVDGVTDVSIIQKAAIGAVAAVLALIKGIVAKAVGSPNTAAILPADEDTPKPDPNA